MERFRSKRLLVLFFYEELGRKLIIVIILLCSMASFINALISVVLKRAHHCAAGTDVRLTVV